MGVRERASSFYNLHDKEGAAAQSRVKKTVGTYIASSISNMWEEKEGSQELAAESPEDIFFDTLCGGDETFFVLLKEKDVPFHFCVLPRKRTVHSATSPQANA